MSTHDALDARLNYEQAISILSKERDALLKERDQLREVLRDVSEERGLTPTLSHLKETLLSARKYLKQGSFVQMYGNQHAHESPLAQARGNLDSALHVLTLLIRPEPDPVAQPSAKLPAEPCKVCSAAAGTGCNAGRHGAAWCYHSKCGRLMRGGVCDNCGLSPPMAEAVLILTNELAAVLVGQLVARSNNLYNNDAAEVQLARAINELRGEPEITVGPRDANVSWCGSCGAAPGTLCRPTCPAWDARTGASW